MCKHEFKDEGFKWDQKTGRLIQTLKCSLCGKSLRDGLFLEVSYNQIVL